LGSDPILYLEEKENFLKGILVKIETFPYSFKNPVLKRKNKGLTPYLGRFYS